MSDGKRADEEQVRRLMMAALDGEISKIDRRELDRLLESDAELRREWESMSQLKVVIGSMKLQGSPSLVKLVDIDAIDQRIAAWMERYGLIVLRVSLAMIFIWYGALKPLGMSPAEELVKRTVYWLPPDLFVPILGWWEVAIGVCLLIRPLIRVGILLLFLQMPGTILPLFLLPEVCFTRIPFGLTLEGQYIVKNLVLIGAAIVVGGTVRLKSDSRRKL